MLLELQLRETEDGLIRRAIEHDSTAFAALYDRHAQRVYRHVYYHVLDRTDAEDITQEVFIKAWKAISKYKVTGAPFLSWLTAIARNLLVDHWKARKKMVPLEEAENSVQIDEANPEELAEASFDQAYIRNAVMKLKGDKRQVIIMRFIDGFSYEEIAKALKKSDGAVRVIQFRALKDLRKILSRKWPS